MRKQPIRSKKQDPTTHFGKGKVTPLQVAFIVDRYLSDNSYSDTRSSFRSEASSLLSKSALQEAPKSLLSLGEMLDDYICLKEQKVMLDREKACLEQEKFRVENLLQGMQNVMTAYNASVALVPTPPSATVRLAPGIKRSIVASILPSDPTSVSPSGYQVNKTSMLAPGSMPEPAGFSTPGPDHQSIKKRSGSNTDLGAPKAAKKSRSRLPKGNCALDVQQASALQSSSHEDVANNQGTNVVKNLFPDTSALPTANSSCPKTPQRALSFQNDKMSSPRENSSSAISSNKSTPQKLTPNCTIVSSKTVIVSPFKHKTCYTHTVERNHCVSASSPIDTYSKRSNKREQVKGRLDFDGSDQPMVMDNPVNDGNSTSESENGDFFDLDLPNLDFSIAELLGDFDIACGAVNSSYSIEESPTTGVSGLAQDSGCNNSQVLSEYSSSVTEVLSGKEISIHGSSMDTLTAVKSITKCIKILSPGTSPTSVLFPSMVSKSESNIPSDFAAKNNSSSMEQEDASA